MSSFLTSMIMGTPTNSRHPPAGAVPLSMLVSLGAGYALSFSSNHFIQGTCLVLATVIGLRAWHRQRRVLTADPPELSRTPEVAPAVSVPIDAPRAPLAHRAPMLPSQVLQACGEAIVVSDAVDRIVLINEAFLHMTGLSPSEVIGHSAELLGLTPLRDSHLPGVIAALKTAVRWSGESSQSCVDGRTIDTWMNVTALRDETQRLTQHIRTFSDISPLKQQQRVLAEQARHDSLTGLPNRRAFSERLKQAMSRARRSPQTLAVLYVDLDGFKAVNDLYGHAVGDQLLISVSRRLESCVRITDCVCRLAGDEFTVILEGAGHPDEVERIGRRILENLSLPHHIEGLWPIATPSIGGTLFVLGDTAESLCERADETMYQAKRAGKARLILNLERQEPPQAMAG